MNAKASLDAGYFERVYATSDDPWDFASSEYEREKYDSTVEFLKPRRFRKGFEIGCSIGVLTALLAPICDRLLAVDVNPKALAAAAVRNAGVPQVAFRRMSVPAEFPSGRFDLIVVSEVGYYWSDDDLETARARIAAAAAGGIVELVHFLPHVDDYVRDGDEVHEYFLADMRFRRVGGKRTERYRLDVLAVSPG